MSGPATGCSIDLFISTLRLLTKLHGDRNAAGAVVLERLPKVLGDLEREYIALPKIKKKPRATRPGAFCWYLTERGNVILRKQGNEPPGAVQYSTKQQAVEAWEERHNQH